VDKFKKFHAARRRQEVAEAVRHLYQPVAFKVELLLSMSKDLADISIDVAELLGEYEGQVDAGVFAPDPVGEGALPGAALDEDDGFEPLGFFAVEENTAQRAELQVDYVCLQQHLSGMLGRELDERELLLSMEELQERILELELGA
jgi:hypothetical protein